MTVIIVSERAEERSVLRGLMRDRYPFAEIYTYESAARCAQTIKTCDIALVALEGDGIPAHFARVWRERHSRANLIFVADDETCKPQALDLRVSGYLTRPVTVEALREELDNLRHPIPKESGERRRIRLQCFGNFEALKDGKAIHFRYGKSKEMLAYLTDARSMCTNEQIMAALWEAEITKSYFRNVRKGMMDALRQVGCENAVTRWRGQIGLNPESVSCDYYDLLNGSPAAINSYWGEYMRQYEWAQFTNNRLRQSFAAAGQAK